MSCFDTITLGDKMKVHRKYREEIEDDNRY